MGSKGDSGGDYVFQPSAEDTLAPIMQSMEEQSMMTQLALQQSQMNMESILGSMNTTLPEVTDYTELDYDAENKALQEKIDKQITEEDAKRSGVLGTILSNEDEDPNTVTSSLLIGS